MTLDESIAVLTIECAAADPGGKDWHALRDAMSEISEEQICAGWESDLEYRLWAMVVGDRGRDYFGPVAARDLLQLALMAMHLGGWVVWGDVRAGEVFMPMSDWLAEYERNGAPYRRTP